LEKIIIEQIGAPVAQLNNPKEVKNIALPTFGSKKTP